MLISCLAEVKRNGGDTRTIGLYGQELINITAAIARMNLVLHGVSDFDIRSGNTLHEPALIEGDRTVDKVETLADMKPVLARCKELLPPQVSDDLWVPYLGHTLDDFTTVNLDFIRHYRPMTNVVNRPTMGGGKGFHFCGHHELMIPLLAAGLLEALDG